MRTAAKVAGVLAGLGLAAFGAEKAVVGRMRRRTDPATDPLLLLPDDLIHHDIATPDGGSLHVLERGEGRPLVLLHGITLAAAIWAPQLHELAGRPGRPGFRVLAVDLRGHARSRAGSAGYGLPVLANDVATVLERLDLHDAVVAGHSMGGMTLMQFAADHPDVLAERVAAVAFVATAASFPMHPFLLSRLEIMGARLVDRLDDGGTVPHWRFSGNDPSLVACRLAFGKRPSAAAVEVVRACIEAMEPDAMQRSGIGLLDHDTREALPSLHLPAVVVVGTRDLLTPRRSAEVIADLLPDGELHVLPDAGHQLMQERPAELDRILRDLSARAPAVAMSTP